MTGLNTPRVQRMIATMFLLAGVFLCVISGPEVLARSHRTEFRITDFLTDEATLEAGMSFVIGVGCFASSWQIFVRTSSR
jgi:hypothetical protein